MRETVEEKQREGNSGAGVGQSFLQIGGVEALPCSIRAERGWAVRAVSAARNVQAGRDRAPQGAPDAGQHKRSGDHA